MPDGPVMSFVPVPIFTPAVIVHGLEMARLAAGEAALAGVKATLLSARGAGVYAGVAWWRALIADASPDGTVDHILDCGEAPGRALEALRAGQRLLVLRTEQRVWNDIAGRAASCGATLLAEAPPALDLGTRGAAGQLPSWLRGQPTV